MNPKVARQQLEALGARTMDCRGFYSHFLRVWYPADAEQSLGTIDFTDAGGIPKRKVDQMARRIERMKKGDPK